MRDPYDDSLIEKLTNHTNKVSNVIYIQNKSILVSGSWDETIKLWNTSDWTVLKTRDGTLSLFLKIKYQLNGHFTK
jgi:WD40 repeat protein